MAEKPTYKLMKDEEFDDFTKRVEETEGWEKIFDKNGTTVYKKKTADSKIHAVKVFTFFADVSADQIYDTLHGKNYISINSDLQLFLADFICFPYIIAWIIWQYGGEYLN